MSESQNIEYKQSWRDEYLKWICGFANAQGGKLYIGMNDQGEAVGLINSKRLLEDIPNKIVNYLGIVTDINLIEVDEKEVVEIDVPISSVPISFRGTYYYRSGATLQELRGTALQRFLLKKLGKTWDDLPCMHGTLDDIDTAAVDYFFQKAYISKRVSENTRNEDLRLSLENLDLITDDGYLKNATLLLFGKRPTKFFPSVEFKIGRFGKDDADLVFQDVIVGNIIQMADKVMDVLKSKYLVSPIHYEGLQRVELLELPEDSLREAIFNAIIHKDYTGAAIQLSVYNDRLILWNEGSLPEGWDIKHLFEKHPSKPTNKTIATIFFKAGFIEAWGRGISKITNGFARANLKEPIFEEAFGGIMVTVITKTNDNDN